MQKFLGKVDKITRICSFVLGVLLVLFSLNLLYYAADIRAKDVILSVHYTFLAGLLIASELNFSWISQYFRLLTSVAGRGLYIVILGTLLLSGPENVVHFLVSLLFLLTGTAYIVLGWLSERQNPNKQKLVEYIQKDESDAQNEASGVPEIKI